MTLTRLQPNMRVLYDGRECVVKMVNECRALLQPVVRRTRVIVPQTGKDAGRQIVIQPQAECINVSPNSELPIL